MKLTNIRKPKYTKPNFKQDWDEATRYLPLYRLGENGWIKLATTGKSVNASTLGEIGNIDLDLSGLEPDKVARAEEAISKGAIELPIVIKFKGEYDLLGGNTRFAMLKSLGYDPEVWLINID